MCLEKFFSIISFCFCVLLEQGGPQTWLEWQAGSFRWAWRAAWGTWLWWTPGQASLRPRPSTCKPTPPAAPTCSRALHRQRREQTWRRHTRTHTPHRDYGVMSDTHTHTQQTHTERLTHRQADTNLVLCCYQNMTTQHNRIYSSVCSKTKKKKKWNNKTTLTHFSQCCILDEGLLTQEKQFSLHTSSSSFSHEKSKTYRPSTMGQILWSWRCFYSTEFLFIYIWIYILYLWGKTCKLTITAILLS